MTYKGSSADVGCTTVSGELRWRCMARKSVLYSEASILQDEAAVLDHSHADDTMLLTVPHSTPTRRPGQPVIDSLLITSTENHRLVFAPESG
ncbi:unnamed protein product [Jaminaea pallidilutea]